VRSAPIVCLLSLSLPLLGWSSSARAQASSVATPDPVATVRSFDRRLRHALERHAPSWSPEAELAELRVQQLVDENLAVTELARGTLGDHWSRVSERQRQSFMALFRELLVRRIASGQLLAYAPEAGPRLLLRSNGTADVGVVVRDGEVGGAPIRRASVDYRLKYLDGKWLLVDLLVDDESVVGQYRQEFDRIIARESFDGLLQRMRKKLG
jgi:phospholipid transport system substrate-binding protein